MNAYLDTSAWPVLLVTLLICALIVGGILRARRSGAPTLRRFEALDGIDAAIDAAIAAERPVFFVPGVRDLDNMQTVAALSLLEPVARHVAERGGRICVPTARSLVMDAAADTVRRAYEDAGRGDLWDPEMVIYISDDQLGFVARVDGLIARERPGLCLLMGFFASESLLLAEGGYHVGAVQIAGTASPVQLPFFVAACEQVLIGEEFFAASASLGGDPHMLGSLRGQDLGKRAALGLIIIGSLLVTLGGLCGDGVLADCATVFERILGAG